MSEQGKGVVGWTLVGVAATLSARAAYIWNQISPAITHAAVDLFL